MASLRSDPSRVEAGGKREPGRLRVAALLALLLVVLLGLSCGQSGTGQTAQGDADVTGESRPVDGADARVSDPSPEPLLPDLPPEVPDGDGAVELPPDLCGKLGCFGSPCQANGDCLSGWCVPHLGEKVCTETCVEECAPGWSCEMVQGTGSDVVFICVSSYPTLCLPCSGDEECVGPGQEHVPCLPFGLEEGSFCGGSCQTSADCPEGYSCESVTDADGVQTLQCRPDSGACECSGWAVRSALHTACSVANELGKCGGLRICGEDGLLPCDAPQPQAEWCNAVDDDCDLLVDEDTCDDGNPCTEDSCGAEGCANVALSGIACDDGDVCTLADHCEEGTCVGTGISCDDGDVCTDDLCDPTGGCDYTFNDAACNDGNACTVADECLDGTCGGVPVGCDCQADADCAQFEDDDLCNGWLFCDQAKAPFLCKVAAGTVVQCPGPPAGPDLFCLVPACAPATGECGFDPVPDLQPCDDLDACTYGESCQAGKCTGAAPVSCNDANPCTDDACDPGAGCAHAPNTAPCEDGTACTVGDQCKDGGCVPGAAAACDDQNPCTDDGCDPATGCFHTANGLPCDDGNACTINDACVGGWCLGPDLADCDDDSLCTDDWCVPAFGCKHVVNAAPCSDGNACTGPDGCALGACAPGPALDCDDGNVCTDDACDPAKGCKHEPNADPCDDGNACTLNDVCAKGWCAGAKPAECGDGNPCTDDQCDPAVGCVNLPNALPCSDADACTAGDLCDGGMCVSGQPVDCDDANLCTTDTCKPQTGCVHEPNNLACSDGSSCTLGDICANGKCVPGKPVSCDDGNVCTDDGCEALTGCVHQNNEGPCDDQDACTVADACSGGECIPGNLLDCDDGEECTDDSCQDDSCAHVPRPPGTKCAQGVCSLGGKCVECVDNAQCAAAEPLCFENACVECIEDADCPLYGGDDKCTAILCSADRACVEDSQPTLCSPILNGDFSKGFESWKTLAGPSCPEKRSVNIVGPFGPYPYDKVLEVKATGAGGCGGYSDAWQDVSVCVTDDQPIRLRAIVNAVYSSVGAGCGWVGWEYPIRIFLEYVTVKGESGRVEFQFTYQNGTCCTIGSSGLVIISCNKIPQNTWVEFVSPDLRTMAPEAYRFTQVRVRGHGWDYTGWVASIQMECF